MFGQKNHSECVYKSIGSLEDVRLLKRIANLLHIIMFS